MSDRYEFQAILKDENNKPYIQKFPSINPKDLYSSTDVYIKLQTGQRVDNIAFQYLGDGRLWWAVCLMNGLKTPFDSSLITGKLLRVPTSMTKINQVLKSNAVSI